MGGRGRQSGALGLRVLEEKRVGGRRGLARAGIRIPTRVGLGAGFGVYHFHVVASANVHMTPEIECVGTLSLSLILLNLSPIYV